MRLFKIAAAFAFMVTAPSMALAQPAPDAGQSAPPILGTVLNIDAQGKSTGKPDMATISLGVTTQGTTAAAAMQENAQRMNALTQALRRAGVGDRDVQTSNISVNPQQEFHEGQPPRITGYQANNQVTAKVRNIDSLGRVIDAAVAAGGNNIDGVSFGYQDADAQLDAARRDAITQARHRADLYAQALGLHVFRVIAVSEGGGARPPVPVMYEARVMAAAAPTPVAPGEIETNANVNVTYELR
jgi:uncharacterized protein YggE